MKKLLSIVLLFLTILPLVFSGCAPGVKPSAPPAESESGAAISSAPVISQPDINGMIPRSIDGMYVVLQDYADNDTSKRISEAFLNALDNEASLQERADDRLTQFGKDLFILNAAVPFEQGTLVCGHILLGGEDYSKLYYLEGEEIKWRAEDSDVWSLNYTVFKLHTIAYGEATGWDNKVVMQSSVTAEFANGQTACQDFKNIPFKSEKSGWEDGSIQTDGYILIADGLTWVKNIQFFDKDGSVQEDWRSDKYHFIVLDSNSPYIWEGQPNEIWTAYRYTQMLNDSSCQIINEITPISIQVNNENAEVQRFLLNETIGMEHVWRNNNNYLNAREVDDISDIDIQGVGKDDKVMWAALDKDDGSPISDYSSICSDKAPVRKGVYCLIINHNGDYVLKHENMYFSMFVKLV